MGMNRWFLIILFFLLCAKGTIAQKFYPTKNTKVNNGVVYGVKVGANSTRLYYTNPHLSVLPHDLMIGPTASVFIEIPFLSVFSIAPELNIQQKGGATSYIYEQDYHVEYKLKAMCASARLPLLLYVPVSKYFKPYVFGAAEIGRVMGGSISLSQPGLEIPSVTLPVSASDMSEWYWGAMAGVGFRVNLPFPHFTVVMKLDAAYNLGLSDTFSMQEHDETATPTNVHAYNHQGARYLRGLEFNVGIGFTPAKRSICDQFNSSFKRQVISYD
jgi:hypothetical protein